VEPRLPGASGSGYALPAVAVGSRLNEPAAANDVAFQAFRPMNAAERKREIQRRSLSAGVNACAGEKGLCRRHSMELEKTPAPF
jgi:hypothetical protein